MNTVTGTEKKDDIGYYLITNTLNLFKSLRKYEFFLYL